MKMPVLMILGFATFAAGAHAQEQEAQEEHTSIAISSSPAHAMIHLDSSTMDFDPHELQEGESRSIVDDSGRAILITKHADGLEFQVDGKTIKMPLLEGAGIGYATDYQAMGVAAAQPVDVRVVSDQTAEVSHGMDGITILSGKPLDQATQESIRSVLLSAGHSGEVRFVDRGHAVKMVRMKVDSPAGQ